MTLTDLKTCRSTRLRISSLQERIVRLRSVLEHPPIALTGGRSGGGIQDDRMLSGMAQLEALERDLVATLVACETACREVEQAIDALPPQQAAVLRLRYIDGLSWRQVAARMHYDDRHCRRIHRVALVKMSANVRPKSDIM